MTTPRRNLITASLLDPTTPADTAALQALRALDHLIEVAQNARGRLHAALSTDSLRSTPFPARSITGDYHLVGLAAAVERHLASAFARLHAEID